MFFAAFTLISQKIYIYFLFIYHSKLKNPFSPTSEVNDAKNNESTVQYTV